MWFWTKFSTKLCLDAIGSTIHITHQCLLSLFCSFDFSKTTFNYKSELICFEFMATSPLNWDLKQSWHQILLLSAPLQRVRMQSLFSVAITLHLLISCMAHVASGTDAEKDLKLPGAKSPGPLERLTAKKTPKPTRKPTGKPIIKTAKPSFRDPGHSCLYNPWVLGC